MNMLDSLRVDGKINEWKSFGYDWRKSVSDVVVGSEKKSTTTESLLDIVKDLALRSKTGKVAIVSHSNGGLVAKYLVKNLVNIGKENLIDSIISVAVPYVGTPKSLAALLHGFEQSMAGGLILRASVARELGANMASAYGLLPSKAYFSTILSPTIAFASSTIAGINDGSYPTQIKTFDDQSAFVGDTYEVRPMPSTKDLSRPIRGNNLLLAASDVIHSILDPFVWPANIARLAVIGWNKPTPSGITYGEKITCSISPILFQKRCSVVPTHTISNSNGGDGTVLAPSAAYEAGTAVSVDLKGVDNIDKKSIDHANILESSVTQEIVRSTIEHGGIDSDLKNHIMSLPGVMIGEPDYISIDQADRALIVSTHSPVKPHIYDRFGNHTGEISPPVGIEEGLFTAYESKIPNSHFSITGDSDDSPETYITIPDDGQTYSVVLEGIGTGEFSFEIERRRAQQIMDSVEYSGLPITPLSIASTTIKSNDLLDDSPEPLASTSESLFIDIDGNGITDIKAEPNVKPDPVLFLESLKKTVLSMGLTLPKSKKIIQRIDRITDLYKKGKLKKAVTVATKIQKSLGHRKFRNLSAADREEILNLIEGFIGQFE